MAEPTPTPTGDSPTSPAQSQCEAQSLFHVEQATLFRIDASNNHEAIRHGSLSILHRLKSAAAPASDSCSASQQLPNATERLLRFCEPPRELDFVISSGETQFFMADGIFFLSVGDYAYSIVFAQDMPEIYISVFARLLQESLPLSSQLSDMNSPDLDSPTPTGDSVDHSLSNMQHDPIDQEASALAKASVGDHIIKMERVGEEGVVYVAEGEAGQDLRRSEGGQENVKMAEETIIIPPAENTPAYLLNSMSSGVEMTSKVICTTVWKSADLVTSSMRMGASLAKANMEGIKEGEPHVQVWWPIQFLAKATAVVTSITATTTRTVVKGASIVAGKMGGVVGGVLHSDSDDKTDRSPFTAAVLNLGSTTIKSVIEVWDSVEEAAINVVDNASDSTLSVLRYRYGDQVAALMENVFKSGGDVLVIAKTIRGAAIRSIAASAALKAVSSGAKAYAGVSKEEEERSKEKVPEEAEKGKEEAK
eukprot:TRINITY_DN3387_c0_g1_i1.p1 TRINITY_DN3387_c0_g1~~TRINITY_DN3387_c0_g1_i1.p1  ORF type:complete len:486 (+),score=145.18 TRINITY_DN3387_c0_g1_i1:25-1458(+)